MYRLPLFPLPVVLFPGAGLPLHIFEPRYRRMVARCLEFDRRFGLVYHDPDEVGPFLSEEGRVGTVARIEAFKPLPDGRSLILVRGAERIRIREGIESDEPYYEAVVEPYEDEPRTGEEALRRLRRQSLELFHAVVDSLPDPPEERPEFDPSCDISFALAATVQIDASWQQSLLELRREELRLERLEAVFQAAVEQGFDEA